MAMNRMAYLLAGAALGAAGMALVKSGKGRDVLQGLVVGGHGLTEKLLATVETVREDVEDYLAEAKYMHEEKAREAADQARAETSPEESATDKTAAGQAAAKKTTRRKTAAKSATKTAAAGKTTAGRSATRKSTGKKTTTKKTGGSTKTAKSKTTAKKKTQTK